MLGWLGRAVGTVAAWLVILAFFGSSIIGFIFGDDFEHRNREIVLFRVGFLLLCGVALWSAENAVKLTWKMSRRYPLFALLIASGWWLHGVGTQLVRKLLDPGEDLALVDAVFPGTAAFMGPYMESVPTPPEVDGRFLLAIFGLGVLALAAVAFLVAVPAGWAFLLVRFAWRRSERWRSSWS